MKEALIDMGNGERITLEEYNHRSRLELEERESRWREKFKDPKIVTILEKAEEVVKRRLDNLTKELQQLNEDDQILWSVCQLHEKEMRWKLGQFVAGCGFAPFDVSIYHHRDLREKLEKKIGGYKSTLTQLQRLKKGKFHEFRDAKLSEFESPL